MRAFTAYISILTIALLAPAAAFAAEPSRVLFDLSLDMDGNAATDHAVLVLNNPQEKASSTPAREAYALNDDETVDLYFYMDAGTAPLDISKPPSFRKPDIVDLDRFGFVFPLEAQGKHSLNFTASYLPGSSHAFDETLTIVYRKGKFIVAGIGTYWEGSGNNGNCQYNFLTSKGHMAPGEFADDKTPIKAKVKAIALDEWSPKTRPTVCDRS